MRSSDDYSRKKTKERPSYQDGLSAKNSKSNRMKQTISSSKQGPDAAIQWFYDYGPLKKSMAIVFAALVIAGSIFFFRDEILNHEQKRENIIEFDAETKRPLEEKLEVIKTEKIAEELEKIVSGNQEIQPVIKYDKRNQGKETPVYIWINKNGNKVYSNKKPVHEQHIPYKEIKP